MIEPLARFLADAGALSVFGILLFRTLIHDSAPRGLLAGSLAAALAGNALWLLLQSESFADAPGTVLLGTLFGRVLLTQAVLLTLGAATGGRWGAVLAGICVAAGAGHGHGVAMGDAADLVVSHAVHLLAAGAWLGGLLPLSAAIAAGNTGAPVRFGRLAIAAVALLTASALWQGWSLGGGLPGLLGTPYGHLLLLKSAGFAAMLALAAWHRWRLVPALPRTRRVLAISVLADTALGLAVLALAAILGGMEPGMHTQPNWPFPWRPDAGAFADPDLRAEVLGGLAWCALALALLAAGYWRRWCWLGLPVALWLGLPHLDLLLMPATQTSFYTAPDPTPASIALGEALFERHCALCHGAGGKGDGPEAQRLPTPPADLTAQHLWDHRDGELFGWLATGMKAPDGQPAMPGFAAVLDTEQRWALIDAIRARNPFRPDSVRTGHHH